MYDETLVSLVISTQKGIGCRTFKGLIDRFTSARAVLEPSNLETIKREFGETVYNIIKNIPKMDFIRWEDEIKKTKRKGISIIPYSSNEYPYSLKQIPDPPAVLYVKGCLPTNLKCISVVGTRRPSGYGRYVVENIVRPLAKKGVCIVSGFATGIDTMAHKVAIEEGGFTVAVFGNGVDVIYPPENRKMYEMIQERGCVISEFPPGTKPSKYTFPTRNRIIAGLSYATFVVEAPEKSGSLITANLAFEYSRIVLTVPANINVISAAGNNRLIKDNIAVPVVSFEDVASNVPFLVEDATSTTHNRDFSEKERAILNFLISARHIDEIKEYFSFDGELDAILFNLMLEGIVKEENNYYYRTG